MNWWLGNQQRGQVSASSKKLFFKDIRMNSQQYKISKGPSKFDLSIALLSDIKEGGNPISVEFAVDDPTLGRTVTFKVVVLSIEDEDGSRKSWNIAGYKIWESGATKFSRSKVKIYFRTDRRSGNLQFVD